MNELQTLLVDANQLYLNLKEEGILPLASDQRDPVLLYIRSLLPNYQNMISFCRTRMQMDNDAGEYLLHINRYFILFFPY